MASQPSHAPPVGPTEPSYLTLATTDNVWVKTVEPGQVTPNRLSRDTFESTQHSQSQRQSSPDHVPSYMAPTQSAKAKVRGHKGQPDKKGGPANGLCFDTSSSGGNVAYQILRSPSPNTKGYGKGVRGQAKWSTGYSPDSSGGDDVSMGRYAWRHHFG